MSDDGDIWLSTRNKSKLPSKTVNLKRRRSLPLPKRTHGHSGSSIFTMTQNSPPPKQLFTATKQSKLDTFFTSLSSQGNKKDKQTNRTNPHTSGLLDIREQSLLEHLPENTSITKEENSKENDVILKQSKENNLIKREANLSPSLKQSPVQELGKDSIEQVTRRQSGCKRLFSTEESVEERICKRRKQIDQEGMAVCDTKESKTYPTVSTCSDNNYNITNRKSRLTTTSSHDEIELETYKTNNDLGLGSSTIGTNLENEDKSHSKMGTNSINKGKSHSKIGTDSINKHQDHSTSTDSDSSSSLNLSKDNTLDICQTNSLQLETQVDSSLCLETQADPSLCLETQTNSTLCLETQADPSLCLETQPGSLEGVHTDNFTLNLSGDTELNLCDVEDTVDQSLELDTQFTLNSQCY